MKKRFYIILILLIKVSVYGQVAIGKDNVSGNSTILDFSGNTATEAMSDTNTTNEKSIILPAVDILPSYSLVNPPTNNPNNGTFLFDKAMKMMRMFENGQWINLSDAVGSDTSLLTNNSAENGKGVIIGANAADANGVLVLESTNKSLVLSHIKNPHSTVRSPYPGMMCYDTVSNSVAVYDGVRWNYWK